MITSKNIQFNKDMVEVQNMDFETVRINSNKYFEAVLLKNKLPDLTKTLEKIFGAPKWPSEKELSGETQEIINGFGGIRDDQSLYFLKQEKDYVFAMLWPWQDGEHITLKISHS